MIVNKPLCVEEDLNRFKTQLSSLSKDEALVYIDEIEVIMNGYNVKTQKACCERCLPKFQKKHAENVTNGKVDVQPFDFCDMCSLVHNFATPEMAVLLRQIVQSSMKNLLD